MSRAFTLKTLRHASLQHSALLQAAVASALFLSSSALHAEFSWTPIGPAGTTDGQVEGMTAQNNPVAGAVHTVLASPTDANVLYLGAVNGGIWKTTNATAANPTWTPLTDFQSSLSIGSLEFDPTDATGNTLIAGIGRYSSNASQGGARTGLLRTTDGGNSWTAINGGLAGKNISGVVARGNTIVASVNVANSFTYGNIGIWRSTDGGANFSQVSGASSALAPNGLYGGRIFDLAADPTNNSVLYASLRDAGANSGIYKSLDTGATWTRVSNATMNALNNDSGSSSTSNIEIAVGNAGQVYVGIMGANGQLTGLFRTGNGGTSWAQLDTPSTTEGASIIGLQPGIKEYDLAGGQGQIHFSIRADATNPNIVYVGGDRQPTSGSGTFPNSIGAENYSGRLFRVDASLPFGSQDISLTHNPTTSNNSSPHADSREMVIDAQGNIIEGDDGGIYKRINPKANNGSWVSLNGNLQVTEFHSVAYDRLSNVVFGGTQDTGTPEQISAGSAVWRSVSQGDGGKVAVYTPSSGNSVRYTSFQNIQSLRRRVVDASNNVLSTSFPSQIRAGFGTSIWNYDTRQFYQPLAVNRVNGNVVTGTYYLWESADGANNFNQLGNTFSYYITCLEAGGRFAGVDDANILFAGTSGSAFYRRISGPTASIVTYGYGAVVDLVMDSEDWHNLYIIDNNQVVRSLDAGNSFTDITGTLTGKNFRTITFASFDEQDVLLVGADDGVYMSYISDLGVWEEIGATTLPNAPVFDLVYDSVDDVLVVGTLGRGAWMIDNFSIPEAAAVIPEPATLSLLSFASLFLLNRRRK